ncbi:ilvG [Symbiodinium pilosum]|uniref:IlvG protein n=1 Tax=Symbiodinium pilosum TaxID=2952 RepID=A0A812QLT3_SYMPI|nr:ilvG [Symbiodinium pilosum]
MDTTDALALSIVAKHCECSQVAAEDAVQVQEEIGRIAMLDQIQTASDPKCPMCRSKLQLHGGRLENFLEGTATLSADERSYLQAMLDGANARQDWSDMNFMERTGYAGSLAASAAAGFAQVMIMRTGWTAGGIAPRADLRVAQLAGAGAAVAFRVWRGR